MIVRGQKISPTYMNMHYHSKFMNMAAVTWLKYCRYGVKLYPINQSINCDHALSLRILHIYNVGLNYTPQDHMGIRLFFQRAGSIQQNDGFINTV